MQRRLAAIFFADVVGYSRLMGEDEAATLHMLRDYQRVLGELIGHHGGRVVDAPGDALLAEFTSAVAAVSCPAEAQRAFAGRNQDLPDNRRMDFRIGVNLGEIVEDGGSLYGDGVNVAARMESLAAAGGICISGKVFDEVDGKVEAGFDFLGEKQVKNIARAVPAYRLLASAAAAPDPARESLARIEQEIRFCTAADGVRLAYATVGQGPPLVKAANWLNHLEFDWDSPVWRHLFRGLAKDRQLIRYDERGNGLSDWDAELSFEMFVRDLETVVDTIGLDRFPLLGISQGCAVSVAYAVRHPERVSHLILYGGYARGSNHRGDPGNVAVRQALKTLVLEGWGRENPNFRQIFTSFFIPGGTHEQMRWFNDLQRMTTSPENAVRFLDTFDDINVTDLLDRVTMPTLVLHCRDDARVSFAEGRLLATSIPGARFVSLDGRNHLILEDEPAFPRFMEEVRNFLAVDSPPARATPSPALAPAGVSDQPSIAVLPFDNMSGDSEQDYFVDGMTEDITTALSRVRWLFVIARHSSFAYKGSTAGPQRVAGELGVRYLLGGSLRRADNRVRITAELIEGATGEHLWAKRFDREVGDIFALQDEVAAAIVGEMEPEMGKAERFRARAKTPGNLDAWDLCQRGLAHLYRYTKDDVEAARQLFRRARDMDPELVAAWCGLAEACYYAIVYGLTDSPDERREEALAAARRAVGLDHEDAAAHCALGRVHYLRREHEAAVPELETAIELNPSLALAHYGLGAALVFAGRAAQERPHVETAIKLNPHDPNMGSFLVRLADACLFLGQHEDALGWARKALRQPGFQWSRHAALIAALGHLGRATPMATRRTATRRRATRRRAIRRRAARIREAARTTPMAARDPMPGRPSPRPSSRPGISRPGSRVYRWSQGGCRSRRCDEIS